MTCQLCNREFDGSCCYCGWKAPALAVQPPEPQWITRECEAAGCTVVIRARLGAVGSRFCKWCQAHGIKAEKIPRIHGDSGYLSREEFGEARYRAISLFSGRDEVRTQTRRMLTNIDLTVEQRKARYADLKAREADMTRQIMALLPVLDVDDVRRLLAQYEAEAQTA